MKDTLERMGISVTNIRGDELQINCPAHKERTGREDRNPSLWINADSGAFICFSCNWKGNLYTLVEQVGGIAPENIKNWVATGPGLLARFQKLMAHEDAPRQQEDEIIHESMLEAFKEVPSELCLQRGIYPSITRQYGVRYNPEDRTWVIPIRDPFTQKLLGWQQKGVDRRLFLNSSRVKKSNSLFGYEHYEGGDMVVVESPLDVLRLASVGVTGAVSTFGCVVSDMQLNIIRGADSVVFAMDNDTAGNEASLDLLNRAKKLGLECWFFNYDDTDQKDVGGMSKTEIFWGLDSAKHMLKVSV